MKVFVSVDRPGETTAVENVDMAGLDSLRRFVNTRIAGGWNVVANNLWLELQPSSQDTIGYWTFFLELTLEDLTLIVRGQIPSSELPIPSLQLAVEEGPLGKDWQTLERYLYAVKAGDPAPGEVVLARANNGREFFLSSKYPRPF